MARDGDCEASGGGDEGCADTWGEVGEVDECALWSADFIKCCDHADDCTEEPEEWGDVGDCSEDVEVFFESRDFAEA